MGLINIKKIEMNKNRNKNEVNYKGTYFGDPLNPRQRSETLLRTLGRV